MHYGMRLENGKTMDLAEGKKKMVLPMRNGTEPRSNLVLYRRGIICRIKGEIILKRSFKQLKTSSKSLKRKMRMFLPSELTTVYTVKDKQSSNNYQNLLGTRFVPKNERVHIESNWVGFANRVTNRHLAPGCKIRIRNCFRD